MHVLLGLKNYGSYLCIILILCSLGFLQGCESKYEGIEVAFSAFEGDEETEYSVTLQGVKQKEDRLDLKVMIGTLPDEKLDLVEFTLTFDENFIEFLGFDNSEYFLPEGSTRIGVDLKDENIGMIRFTVFRNDGGTSPQNGLGELMELHLRGIRYIDDLAQIGGCKSYTGEANFTYVHLIDSNLFNEQNNIITGISWYGGVICIFDSSD